MFKILVVDDDETVNLFISRLLMRKFACDVVTAKNGLEALSKIKEEEPEVMFLDVTMPVMSGIETLEAIRADNQFKDLPVIMLTAVSEKEVVSKVMNLGVFDYMLKPLIYDTAYNRIKEIFDNIKKMKSEKEEEENSADGDVKKEKILIVDRDKDFREAFRTALAETYKIYDCESGEEGFKIFMKEKPQILLLGQNLPLLNEKLFAQKIRNLQKDKGVKIFAIREEAQLNEFDKQLYDYVIPKMKNTLEIKSALKGGG